MAASIFGHLTAPLTSLTLREEGPRDPQPTPPAAASDAGRLLRSLAAFTQLRSLSAVLPTDDVGQSGVSNALVPALPDLIAALHEPLSLSISADSATMQHVVPLLAATSLTRLHLRLLDLEDVLEAEFPEFLQRLSQCAPQDLRLHFQEPGPPGIGMAPLRSLTALTALQLWGWSCMGTRADCEALAAMTSLQQLYLDSAYGGFEQLPRCIASLHALSALTSLYFRGSEEDEGLVRRLAAQPLPVLQELTLALYDPFSEAEDLARYAGSLPALRHLTVNFLRSPPKDYNNSRHCSDSADHPRNAALRSLGHAENSLKQAAASAGFELSMTNNLV